jgi:hypothetical protein
MFAWRKADGPERLLVGARRPTQVSSFNHDGLELAKVKRRRSKYLPLWHLVFFIYVILIVRLIAMADMGPVAYQSRIDSLSQGNLFERFAAKVMYMDPVSRSISVDLRKSLRAMQS